MRTPRLAELLAIPYRLQAETIETRGGTFVIRLAYPELPGCVAEGLHLEEVLADLERRRMDLVLALAEQGRLPPPPRPPLAGGDPLWTARDLGASARVIAALEQGAASSCCESFKRYPAVILGTSPRMTAVGMV